MAPADGHRRRSRPHRRPRAEPRGSGAHVRRAAGFIVWSQVEAGHLCPVSMTYAAVPATRAQPRPRGRLSRGSPPASTTPGLAAAGRQARRHRRHGHDREAGRLGCPRQHHPRRAHRGRSPRRRRHVPAHRPQVVHVRADERRVPRPRPDRPAPPASWCPASSTTAAATPSPCSGSRTSSGTAPTLLRGRVRRHVGGARRRRGPRRADHHRHGRLHAAGLCPRVDGHDAPCPSRGPSTTHGTAPRSAPSSSTSP